MPASFPELTLRSVDGFLSFFGRFYKISFGATLTVLLWVGLLWKQKEKNKKQKNGVRVVSPFSYGGQKKTGGFCLFLSVNTCPTQLAMPGVYILGVQDFFSHICLPDRRSILLFWEQTGRQVLLICVFLFYSFIFSFFFWEASGVNFRALIDWAKASILMIDRRRCDGSDISFPFLSLGFAINVFFFFLSILLALVFLSSMS